MSRPTQCPAPDDRPEWRPPWPQTWGQVYVVLTVWLLACLGLAFLADWLAGVL